ncbi:teichoic acid D-Ala incorporation-associated protein DltX [Leuconostoc lactis]
MIKRFFQRPIINFVSRTLFYFCVILILVYLYSYSGVGQGHFIYNEF